MAISQLFKFLRGAHRLAKLDPAIQFPGVEVPDDQLIHHGNLVRAGKFGALVGAGFGAWMGYELFTHPNEAKLDSHSALLALIGMPLMALIVGIMCGVCWAGLFVDRSFFDGPIGRHWMQFAGVKSALGARVVAIITALLTTGFFVFLCVCVRLGKI